MIRGSFSRVIIISALVLIAFSTPQAQVKEDQQIKNLRSFAKLYGYVRFFHPSDESASLDWDKFAVAGAEDIVKCKNENELKEALKKWYLPVAPAMQIYSNEKEIDTKSVEYSKDTTGMDVIAWQHCGVWLSKDSYDYRSYRVTKGAKIVTPSDDKVLTHAESKPQQFRMFEAFPKTGEMTGSKLTENILFKMPLTLYSDSTDTQGKNRNYPFEALAKKIYPIITENLTGNDLSVRLADVIIEWNICRHFYPYFDVVKVDWNEVLTEYLIEAFKNNNNMDFYTTLQKMTAKLEDGHAIVFREPYEQAQRWPLRAELVNNKLYVVRSMDTAIKQGVEIKSIDGKPVLDLLHETESRISGSKHYRRSNALMDLGNGPKGKKVKLEISDGEDSRMVEVDRNAYSYIPEYEHPAIKKIEDGIYYINAQYASIDSFLAHVEDFKSAKGIVFDMRFTSMPGDPKKRIDFFHHIISRTIKTDFGSPQMLTPCFVYPEGKEVTYNDGSWTAKPYTPSFFNKNLVFIIDPTLISWQETLMGIVEGYKLGEIVGAPTAGANGTMNKFHLPGGYTFRFTGRVVKKQDGSQHHLIGIQPTYPVIRTVEAIKEGRDEYLEKAIDVIKSKLK